MKLSEEGERILGESSRDELKRELKNPPLEEINA